MINLILCGGAGTRLWPLSRNRLPKQFYPLFDGRTLFEETVLRNKDLVKDFWVASNRVQRDLAEEQLKLSGISTFGSVVEPFGRNTAPAIALVALCLHPEELLLVTPSEHLVTNTDEYKRAVNRAIQLADDNFLVTFGIKPTYAETGFGYIEADGELVTSFKEKPDIDTAQGYVNSGRYFWNSGMFVFKAGVFLEELQKYAPEVFDTCQRAIEKTVSKFLVEPTVDLMQKIPSVSVDIAVMEKSKKVRVVPCAPGWTDLGSFDSLFEEACDGLAENVVMGAENPIFVDAKKNMIIGGKRKVALVDVEDLIVVDTNDALLIIKQGSSQKVKNVVMELRKTNSELLD